jgi:FkbM family methyltransferase
MGCIARTRSATATALLWAVNHSPAKCHPAWVYRRAVEPELQFHPRRAKARTKFGCTLVCRTDDYVQRHIYAFGVWEPDITRFIASRLHPGDCFIDVGANIGYHTLLGSRAVGSTGIVVAIEPSASIRTELTVNLALNRANNVRIVSEAASDHHHVAVIHRGPDGNRGASTLAAHRGFPTEHPVVCAPLGDLLTPEEITRARIFKVDVEGHEFEVTRGLLPFASALRPDCEILLELSPEDLQKQGHSTNEVLDHWFVAGFHAYVIPNRYDAAFYLERRRAEIAPRLESPPPCTGPALDVILSRIDAPSLRLTAD